MYMFHKFTALLTILLFVGVYSTAVGQGTNTGISGLIIDTSGQPMAGATVVVKNESTGFTAGTVSGLNGVYNIRQLPLGVDYTITVSFVGFKSQKRTGYALNQGDQLRLDFTLEESTQLISEITVTANPLALAIEKMGAKTSVTAKDMATLPVNGRNFTSLIDLSPVSRGSNLLGQLFSSTNYTIDGMTNRSPLSSGTTNRGPFSISMEAIREFEIVTNDYDVVNGRSGGGTVSAVTKAGTNLFTGSGFLYNRADWLASPYDTRGNRRQNEFSVSQYGITMGGPIVKDKVHFFVAYDGQFDARPLYIADIRTPQDEVTNSLSRVSLDRFLAIARGKYGVSESPQTGSFDKNRYSHAAFARIDWQVNEKNLLTIRNNYSRDLNVQGVNDNSRHNLYEVYGDHLSAANSFLTSLRTTLGSSTTNELKLQYLYTLDDGRPNAQLPTANIPRAIVERVESSVNSQNLNTTIQIGGQRYLPETFRSNVFQLVNNVYHTRGKVNYTVGADVLLNNLSSLATSEFNGRFFFTGLNNFDNKTPYRYAREVAITDPTVVQNILGSGVYAQGQMMLPRGMDLTLGLRADYTTYLNKPNFNEIVFEDLGLKTDVSASGFQIQPRAQFTWDVGQRQTDFIKVGAGIFGSALNNYSDVNNLQFDGTKIFAIDIQGPNVPIPDFEAYRRNPATAPGIDLLSIPGVNAVTTINMNSEDIKVPTVYKGNLSYNRFFGEKVRLGANFIASFARNNYMYIDRNMVDEPFFRLANENNRGVYVPASTINANNGSTNWTQGRKSNRIGRVLELVSEGENDTYTLIVDGTFRYFRDGQMTASYTRNNTRDNTSYNGNVANSATLFQMVVDDPRDLSVMSYSNAHFKDKVVLYGTLPSMFGVNVGVRYSGIGGTRYSLRVSGNVNGDFVNSNDLAFVFDPNNPNTSATVATAMRSVLDNEDNLARKCIAKYVGTIAERNGCENDFFGTWDVRIAKRFIIPGMGATGFELSMDLFNISNLINKESGTTKILGDQNLQTIRSFDRTSNQYVYSVNTNVGVINPGGTPYQFQVSGKILF